MEAGSVRIFCRENIATGRFLPQWAVVSTLAELWPKQCTPKAPSLNARVRASTMFCKLHLSEGNQSCIAWGCASRWFLPCRSNDSHIGRRLVGQNKVCVDWHLAKSCFLACHLCLLLTVSTLTCPPGARAATISASRDLYGDASTETNTVRQAWAAVGVN